MFNLKKMRENNILPIDAVIAVTYKCNAKCKMCDIWKMDPVPELSAEDYLRLPSCLKYVNISGGEPFLRKDIIEIVSNIKKACPKACIIISTNGFLTQTIKKKMKEILKIDSNIGVAVSIDGIGDKHNEIRGVDEAYNKAMDTIEKLKKLGMGKKQLRIAFTISKTNANHFVKAYDLSEYLGVEFTCAVAQSSPMYFGGRSIDAKSDEKIGKEFDCVIDKLLNKKDIKSWLRAYFVYGLKDFAINGWTPLKSDPAGDFFFMDPMGNVFPSVVHNKVIGNIKDFKYIVDSRFRGNDKGESGHDKGESVDKIIDNKENSFNNLWNSAKANLIRKEIKEDDEEYWMICTARTAMRKNWFKVGMWIVGQKINKIKK